MKYINGLDLPEHVTNTIRNVVMKNGEAAFTCGCGEAVLISRNEYDRLKAMSENRMPFWYGHKLDHELDCLTREEIDY